MKKIIIFCNSLVGLISFRKELIKELINQQYNVTVIAPNHEYKKDVEKMNAKFIPIEMELRGTNPIKDLKLIKNFKKMVKKEAPNIVLTYTIKPNVYGGYVCSKLNIPYICNVTGLGTSVEEPGMLQKITLFLYKIGLKKAKCIFFQNNDNLEFMLKNNIIKKNYNLIPGSGVNLNYHTLIKYPEDDGIIRFLFIARIMHEKGIDEFLKLAKYIKKKYVNTEFHILGSCDDESYLLKIKKYEKQKIVIYHGQVKNVREYHKISNCTIHPSFYPEGMSNVLLESCAAGRPIITTNRPGCKEIVEDGYNGYIIKCQDTKALKNKVEKFINLPYKEKQQMGLNGRKKVEKEFDRNIVINAYMEEIKRL